MSLNNNKRDKEKNGKHHHHHHGLSGLLLIFILIAVLIAVGSGALMRMMTLIFANNYNIPAQGSKIVAEITKVCQGTEADVKRIEAPPPYIQAQCDSCDTLKYKSIVRTALAVVEAAVLWVKWPIGVAHAIYKGIRFGINLATGPVDPFTSMYGDGKSKWDGTTCVADKLNSSISNVMTNTHLRIPIGIDQKLLVQGNIDVSDTIRGLSMGDQPVDPSQPDSNYDSAAIEAEIDNTWKKLNYNMYELFTISGDQTYAQTAFSSDNSISPTYTVAVSEEKINPQDPNDPFTIAVTLRPEHAKRFAESAEAYLESSFSELARTAGKKRGGIYEAEITARAKNVLTVWDEVVKIVNQCNTNLALSANPKENVAPPKSRDCWFPIVVGIYDIEEDMENVKTAESKLELEMLSRWYGTAKGIAEEASYQMYGKYSSSVDSFKQTPLNYDSTTQLKHFDSAQGVQLEGDGLKQYQEKLAKLRTRIFEELKSSGDCPPQEFDFQSAGKIVSSSCAFITSCIYEDKVVKANEGCMLAAVNLDAGGLDLSGNKEFVAQMAAVPIIPITRGNVNTVQTYIAEAVGIVLGGEASKATKSWSTYGRNCAGNDDRIIIFCLENKRPECDMPGLCQTCWSATCAVKSFCDHATVDPRIVLSHEGSRFVIKGAVHPM